MANHTAEFLGLAAQTLTQVFNQNTSDSADNTSYPGDTSNTGMPSDNQTTIDGSEIAQYSQYLHREYFYFMLSCYYFIIVGVIRMIYVSKQTAEENIEQRAHNSYFIKLRLSLIMALLYVLSYLSSQFVEPANFWQAYFPKKGTLNFFGAGAWYISYKLLELERAKEYPQHILTHRFFWIASFIIFLVKQISMHELKTLNIIYNFMNLAITLVLSFYSMYKPFDTDYIERRDHFSMPYFARRFFERFENLFFVRYFCGESFMPDPTQEPLLSKKSVESRHMVREMKDYMKKNKSISEDDHEQYMRKNLPQNVQISIARRTAQREGSKETQFYFEVKTSIEDREFIQEKRYSDFLALEKNMQTVINPRDFPELAPKQPKFEKITIDAYPDERSFVEARVQVLESYLKNLFAEPGYICPLLLNFLGVDEDTRAPYETYFTYAQATQKFKTKKEYIQPADIELPTINTSQHATPRNHTPGQTSGGTPAAKTPRRDPSFQSYCEHSQKSLYGAHYEYVFVISDKNNPSQVAWRVLKTFTHFKKLHQSLESESGRIIPYFSQYIPMPISQSQTSDPNFITRRKEGLEKYLAAILQNRVFYTKSLFEFLEYDPEKKESMSNTPRLSTTEDPLDVSKPNLTQSAILPKREAHGGADTMTKSAITGHAKPDAGKQKHYKTVYTGPYKRSVNLNFCKIAVPAFKQVRKGQDVYFLFEMYLEQFEPKNKSNVKLRVIQYRRFRDFQDLRYYASTFYKEKEVAVPEFKGGTSIFGNVDPVQRKSNVEEFMNKMLALPMINEWNEIREFLMVENLRSEKSEPPVEGEIFDYRDDTIYDEVVEATNSSIVKDLLKKANVFNLLTD